MHLSVMCKSRVSEGGGTPQPNREGVSAGRTGLGEAVEGNELHGRKKEDSGVKKLMCIISFVASSNGEREEGLKGLKRVPPTPPPSSSVRKKNLSSSNR